MTTANPISEIEQRKVFDELEPEVRQRVERDMMELNDDRPYIMAFTRWSKSKGKYVDELDTDSDDDWPDSDDAVDADEQRQPDATDVALQFHNWGFSIMYTLDCSER